VNAEKMDTMQRSKAERDLTNRGFRRVSDPAPCASCQVNFEWWFSPKRKLLPFTSSDLQPHWKKCRHAFQNHLPPTGPETHFRYPYGMR
jgi:hypothetical protein